jgi:hypothetical protein
MDVKQLFCFVILMAIGIECTFRDLVDWQMTDDTHHAEAYVCMVTPHPPPRGPAHVWLILPIL